jgi:hypothetical protein
MDRGFYVKITGDQPFEVGCGVGSLFIKEGDCEAACLAIAFLTPLHVEHGHFIGQRADQTREREKNAESEGTRHGKGLLNSY